MRQLQHRFYSNVVGPGLHHSNGLRVATWVNIEGSSFVLSVAELHGLSGGRSLIKQGGIGHRQASDVTDHGLVVEERLQATLRDLGLVGCILSHPACILQEITLDGRRY